MRSKIKKILLTIVVTSLLFLNSNSLEGTEENVDTLYSLKLASIGFPTASKQKTAHAINDLLIFKNKLYLGYGDAVVNTGPTDIIYYDFNTKDFVNEFTIEDEAIYTYQVVDEKLIIPGPDATENWKYGNIYLLTDYGWIKKRTVQNALHINNVVSFQKKWYVATGTYFSFGEKELFAFGGILSSENEGDTWKLVYATPTDEKSVFRVGSIITFKNKLYAFPYAFTGYTYSDIPEEYRKYLKQAYGDNYLIFNYDPLGTSDAIVFDGNIWRYINLVDKPDLCYISPFTLNGKLILSTISGRFVDYLSLKDNLPKNAHSSLLCFDGEKLSEIPLSFNLIKDKLIKKNKLYLLIVKNARYFVVETGDLENWKYYALPAYIYKPTSIEYDGNSFYIGTEIGNIFKSTVKEKLDDLVSLDKEKPLKFYGACQLPRDGKFYWAAITGWEQWGKLAKITCEVKSENLIDIKTKNVSSFNIFFPSYLLNREKPTEVKIDNETAFKDTLGSFTELVCVNGKTKKWQTEKGVQTEQTFRYRRKIIGHNNIQDRINKKTAGVFLANVLQWSVSADVAIIPESGIRKPFDNEDVALEDVFDLTYRDTIWTFSVQGAELFRMMEFNLNQDDKTRCLIGGFNLSYSLDKEKKEKRIVETSLDPAKTYTVATTGYLVKNMDRLLGEEVNSHNSNLGIQQAMLRWFGQFREITDIQLNIIDLGFSPHVFDTKTTK